MANLVHLIEHTKQSIRNAYNNESKLTLDILNIHGMSGYKTRHLYNNICSLPGCNYLEIGTYKGSSFISAMYGNTANGYCVDNWSEFGGKPEFFENVKTFLTSNDFHFTILDKNCWTITKYDIPLPIDIYMYDGAHTYEDHKNAITHFAPFFAKYVVIIVDDWMCDWVHVKQGTMDGLVEAGLKIHYSHEIGLVNTESYHTSGDTFWNGCGVFVCEKM